MRRKPIAVITSDVHYNPSRLALADASMRQALAKAKELKVPLIVAGDLMDQKAVIRGECANAVIELFASTDVPITVLVGNHSLLNEKGTAHALNFLRPYAAVVDSPTYSDAVNATLLPYYSDSQALKKVIAGIPSGSRLIMHQGVMGAEMGSYVVDRSSLPKETFADLRCISGHYHKAQDIKCGRPRAGAVGLFSYIGSPYTMSFAEANDGPKGFRVLYDDGLMDLIPTNLRKHVIIHCSALLSENGYAHDSMGDVQPNDLVQVRMAGPRLLIEKYTKKRIGEELRLPPSYRLDLIPTDNPVTRADEVKGMTNEQTLDHLIDGSTETAEMKTELKKLWREVL